MDLLGDDSASQSANDGGEEAFDDFKINEAFKARYEHNERRKLLEKGKLKYGDALNGQPESESSSSEDDSDAELLNPQVEKKFLEVLTAIRNNDPKLKEVEKPIFEDNDFEKGGKGERKKDKAFTLKDQIRT